MFRYLMVGGHGNGRMTVVISGDAVFTHAAEMQKALGEALDSCDHLTVDVVAAGDVDLTFRVLLCSLHRRSELINKRITVQVAQTPGREERPGRFARVEGCLFKDATNSARSGTAQVTASDEPLARLRHGVAGPSTAGGSDATGNGVGAPRS